jgi:hypothetical protein
MCLKGPLHSDDSILTHAVLNDNCFRDSQTCGSAGPSVGASRPFVSTMASASPQPNNATGRPLDEERRRRLSCLWARGDVRSKTGQKSLFQDLRVNAYLTFPFSMAGKLKNRVESAIRIYLSESELVTDRKDRSFPVCLFQPPNIICHF